MKIIEDRLIELFTTLPKIDKYDVSLEVGDDKDLNKFLNLKRKEVSTTGGNIYPLLWVQTPIRAEYDKQFIESSVRLVIATLSNSNLSNLERLNTTFADVLNPTVENVKTALRESGFSEIIREEYTRTNFFNYGNDQNTEHVTTDIWDAVLFECDIRVNQNCLQKIKYTYGNIN